MKHLKKFESDNWKIVEESVDVHQLMEILLFKYGKGMFVDILKDINEDEGDYNPDEFYDQIKYILEINNIYDDFVANFEKYSIEKDENDPFHWRHREKQMKKFGENW